MKTKELSDSDRLIAELRRLMKSPKLTECERKGLAKALVKARNYNEKGRQVLIIENARFLLFRAAKLLSPKQFKLAVESEPRIAVMYAAELLSPEQLEEAIKTDHYIALSFAAKLLNQKQLKRAAKAEPWAALRYASKFLSPKLRDWCKKYD